MNFKIISSLTYKQFNITLSNFETVRDVLLLFLPNLIPFRQKAYSIIFQSLENYWDLFYVSIWSTLVNVPCAFEKKVYFAVTCEIFYKYQLEQYGWYNSLAFPNIYCLLFWYTFTRIKWKRGIKISLWLGSYLFLHFIPQILFHEF